MIVLVPVEVHDTIVRHLFQILSLGFLDEQKSWNKASNGQLLLNVVAFNSYRVLQIFTLEACGLQCGYFSSVQR
jgi:hypothetical protein